MFSTQTYVTFVAGIVVSTALIYLYNVETTKEIEEPTEADGSNVTSPRPEAQAKPVQLPSSDEDVKLPLPPKLKRTRGTLPNE